MFLIFRWNKSYSIESNYNLIYFIFYVIFLIIIILIPYYIIFVVYNLNSLRAKYFYVNNINYNFYNSILIFGTNTNGEDIYFTNINNLKNNIPNFKYYDIEGINYVNDKYNNRFFDLNIQLNQKVDNMKIYLLFDANFNQFYKISFKNFILLNSPNINTNILNLYSNINIGQNQNINHANIFNFNVMNNVVNDITNGNIFNTINVIKELPLFFNTKNNFSSNIGVNSFETFNINIKLNFIKENIIFYQASLTQYFVIFLSIYILIFIPIYKLFSYFNKVMLLT